jgi:hypothetical protein
MPRLCTLAYAREVTATGEGESASVGGRRKHAHPLRAHARAYAREGPVGRVVTLEACGPAGRRKHAHPLLVDRSTHASRVRTRVRAREGGRRGRVIALGAWGLAGRPKHARLACAHPRTRA